jgi:hypothetical protein
VNCKTIYTTLQRRAEEEFAGLPDKSRARKEPRKATLKVRNEIRKLPTNPLLVSLFLIKSGDSKQAVKRYN